MTADERVARALSGWAFGEPLEKLKARLVAAVEDAEKEEREACARTAEILLEYGGAIHRVDFIGSVIAGAIRSRGGL